MPLRVIIHSISSFTMEQLPTSHNLKKVTVTRIEWVRQGDGNTAEGQALGLAGHFTSGGFSTLRLPGAAPFSLPVHCSADSTDRNHVSGRCSALL